MSVVPGSILLHHLRLLDDKLADLILLALLIRLLLFSALRRHLIATTYVFPAQEALAFDAIDISNYVETSY